MKTTAMVARNSNGVREFIAETKALILEKPWDLLIEVKAVSINPADIKAMNSIPVNGHRVLGWDGAGIVVDIGASVTDFAIKDAVYYAGDLTRDGSYARYQLVDSRVVGKKPATLDFASSAALPLTSLTAWEGLFDRLVVEPRKSILIIGGAGGVGSMAIQLAHQAGLHVIATASRLLTQAWVLDLGAHEVINHYEDFLEQLNTEVDYIFCLNNTDQHWDKMARVIKPYGKICAIVGNTQPVDLNALKSKSVTFGWEYMFTPTMYQTEGMNKQGVILNEIARRIDQGELRHTLTETYQGFTADNFAKAHAKLASGSAVGKTVIAY